MCSFFIVLFTYLVHNRGGVVQSAAVNAFELVQAIGLAALYCAYPLVASKHHSKSHIDKRLLGDGVVFAERISQHSALLARMFEQDFLKSSDVVF